MLIDSVRAVYNHQGGTGSEVVTPYSQRHVGKKEFYAVFSNYGESDYMVSRALTLESIVDDTHKYNDFEMKMNISLKKLVGYDWEKPLNIPFTDDFVNNCNFEDYIRHYSVSSERRANYLYTVDTNKRSEYFNRVLLMTNSLFMERAEHKINAEHILFAGVTRIDRAGELRKRCLFNAVDDWSRFVEYWVSEELLQDGIDFHRRILQDYFLKKIRPALRMSSFVWRIVPQSQLDALLWKPTPLPAPGIMQMAIEGQKIASVAARNCLIDIKPTIREHAEEVNADFLGAYQHLIDRTISQGQVVRHEEELEIPVLNEALDGPSVTGAWVPIGDDAVDRLAVDALINGTVSPSREYTPITMEQIEAIAASIPRVQSPQITESIPPQYVAGVDPYNVQNAGESSTVVFRSQRDALVYIQARGYGYSQRTVEDLRAMFPLVPEEALPPPTAEEINQLIDETGNNDSDVPGRGTDDETWEETEIL